MEGLYWKIPNKNGWCPALPPWLRVLILRWCPALVIFGWWSILVCATWFCSLTLACSQLFSVNQFHNRAEMGDFILYGIHPEPIPPCKTCQNSTRAAFETAVRKLFTSFAQASVRTSFAQSQNYLAHEPIEHQVQTCFTLKTNQHQISAKPVCASSRKLAQARSRYGHHCWGRGGNVAFFRRENHPGVGYFKPGSSSFVSKDISEWWSARHGPLRMYFLIGSYIYIYLCIYIYMYNYTYIVNVSYWLVWGPPPQTNWVYWKNSQIFAPPLNNFWDSQLKKGFQLKSIDFQLISIYFQLITPKSCWAQ